MEIHKPKPWHGWREFAKEYAIIVLGVLTALAAEQVVEALHWRHQVAAGEEALRAPFARDIGNSAILEAQAPCVTRRLAELTSILQRAEASGRLPAVGPLGHPDFSPWTVQTWDALVAAQTVAHLPQDKMLAYTALRQRTAFLSGQSDLEREDWTILSSLEGPGRRLSDAEAEQLRLALAKASDTHRQMLRGGPNLREVIKETGLVDPAVFAAADRRAAAGDPTAEICRPLKVGD